LVARRQVITSDDIELLINLRHANISTPLLRKRQEKSSDPRTRN
jgi:hypothetical protein